MMELAVNLTPEQARFALWVTEKMPFLQHLFDWQDKAYRPEEVQSFLASASHGEALMARFVVGVWRHDDEYEFDLIEAACSLDTQHRKIIADWFAEPFWP